MKTYLGLAVIAAIGCAHSSQTKTATDTHVESAVTSNATTDATEQTAATSNKVVAQGPIKITTVTRDYTRATPKRPAKLHVVTRIEERAPTTTTATTTATGSAVLKAVEARTATEATKTTQTTQTASKWRLGPSWLGWAGIAFGVLAAVALAWKFRKLLGIGI